MVMARHYHTATLLPDGRVLVAGDFAGDDLSSSAELYDPRTATWTATGSMMHGRWDYVATLLPDGTVLVAGGEDRASASSAELYDPGSGTWTTTGSMTDARQWPTSALLQDGNVLVTGGNGAREEVASAELYDPRSHTWTATGSMHVARRNFTATLLRDGTVLVAGGIPDDPASVSAELYDPGNLPSVVVPSQLPIAEPSAAPVAGRIVYTRFRTLTKGQEGCKNFCHRASVFTSNEDGSDERELIPGPYSFVVAMSPDGSSLIISQRLPDGDHGYLTDVDGSKPQRLDTGCRLPCVEDSVGSFWWPAVAFSPDGSRLAFVRGFGDDILGDPRSVIAIMDMATGAVVELDSTAGAASPPSWSPDGARLVFGSFVVNADGTNLLQVVPAALSSGATFGGARWSPDGSLIVFTSFVDTVVQGNSQRLIDIYTVRPDGSGLQRITTDSVGPLGTTEPGDFGARYPSWTRDGRIVFTRDADQGEAVMQLWVMDRDGSNATRLDPSDAATLTAIGCVSCQYPATDAGELPSVALWITAP
jgi:Tol biopolymer transport system component